jgi:hypothetical protein
MTVCLNVTDRSDMTQQTREVERSSMVVCYQEKNKMQIDAVEVLHTLAPVFLSERD